MILDRRMLVLAQRIFTPSMLGIALLTASCGSLPKESAEAQSQRPQRESRETAVDVRSLALILSAPNQSILVILPLFGLFLCDRKSKADSSL